jgi:hypothetical protein
VVDGGRTYDYFRGGLLCAGLPAEVMGRLGFEEIPANQALLVGRDLSMQLTPLA